ncbi:efflux RND transporter permease subunit [Pseudoxanthomonas sp. J35]|uniref:efflux RND transporter permease subunit n=1 Tax=Pseudoxanthomonas sp. J35 TaxID=935852 RepID=UPI00048D08F0|nr:efflux RND transporter permease subunit [Pseudoxanthomonas sp. J35]
MNISAWAIRRPLPAVMVFFVLCVAGLWGFHKLAVARFPDIAFPMVTVTVMQPGAVPSQLEAEVTRRVEDSVATIPGIKRIMSTVNEGVSTTMVEFQLETDLATALDDTRDAVTRIRTDLPQDIQEPVISKVDIGGALMTYALVAPRMTADEASWFVDREVTRAMYGVPGVAEVTRVGGVDRQVRVDLDPDALQAFGVTAGDVSAQLAKIQVERAGGRALQAGSEQVIRTIGTVADARALEEYSISLPDGRAVRLSALARVRDAAADPTEAALLDGEPVVAFSMSRTRGSSEVEVEAGVQAALEQLKAEHPGIDFRLVTTAIDETHRSYDSSMTMLWEGALLALLVVWLFLRDWRATWVSAVALPLSIIPTFAVMHWLGFSLNMITLLALAVVVGILVDDAIVEIENIVRHLRMGKKPVEAAREAAGEIGNAVIATSLTLAAVFVPVAFMPGIAGKFFREFGWTAATAVLFSLLVARLLTPMMAAYLLKPHDHEERETRLMRWYLGWVDAALRHRARTLWIATGLFFASLALVPLIPTTFIPTSDMGRSNLSLELPPGTRLERTLAVAERARGLLADIPELKQVYTTVGSVLDLGDPGASSVGEARKATLVLDWGPADGRGRDQTTLEREVRRRLSDLPGVRVSYISSEPGNVMQLVLSGDDPRQLNEAALALERDLRTIPGLGSGPPQISRYQRQRNVTLTAELSGRPLGEVMEAVQGLPSVQNLPPGVGFLNAGDAEVFVELFVGFLLAMVAGIVCIYMVLLLLFNHALMPLTILVAVPLCAGGAFGALLLTQNMLSLPALIGLLMLIGIATKNSILLVDYAVIAEDGQGMSQHDALIDACRKCARPIVMTTLAMGAGMLPIALGLSVDSSFRAPMAIAVIGGLITSTLLSLIVIPAVYTVLDDLGEWFARRFRHRSSHPPREAEAG